MNRREIGDKLKREYLKIINNKNISIMDGYYSNNNLIFNQLLYINVNIYYIILILFEMIPKKVY